MTTRIIKTWFDGEKIATQEIPEADFYKAHPAQVSEYECRKLLYGFMLDCNAVGL
jgi:hypothetical protein